MWPAAAILAAWLMRRWPVPAVAVVLLLSLPSPLLVGAWTAAGNLQMLSRDQLAAADWAATTPARSVFVTDGWLHSFTDPAGRLRVGTFGPYVANLGYDPDPRDEIVRSIYCGGDAARAVDLARGLGAAYIVDAGRPTPCPTPTDFAADATPAARLREPGAAGCGSSRLPVPDTRPVSSVREQHRPGRAPRGRRRRPRARHEDATARARCAGRQRPVAHRAGRRDLRPRRTVRLRQDDDDEDDQPPHRADERPDHDRRRRRACHARGRAAAEDRLRHPAGRPLSAPHDRRQRGGRAAPPALARRRASGPASTSCSSSSASIPRRIAAATRRSCRVASASASAWHARSPPIRR